MLKVEAITGTRAAITVVGTMREDTTAVGEATPTSIGPTSPGMRTKIDRPTGTTLSAGRTTATSGSATGGIVGMAVGTPTASDLAGSISMACGSGTRWYAHYEAPYGARMIAFRTVGLNPAETAKAD